MGHDPKPPKVTLDPAHPERICWGCPKYCPAAELACGNGTIRTPHPIELFGDDWLEWERDRGSAPLTAGGSTSLTPGVRRKPEP
jgi:hypothetical protein